MSSRITTSLAAVTLAASAAAALAQTTVAPDPSPAKVGVTQPTAIDAESKAVPRSDTGTLVRTGKARRSMAAASSADGSMATSNGMASAGSTNSASTATANAGTESAIDNAAPTAAGRRARHARN